jgi:pyrimidine-nucleoside phosphorylase
MQVLDVKTGSGAFMQKHEDAIGLAQSMIAAGENAGIHTVAMITSMDQPLGRTMGNWNEILETLDILKGVGPADVTEVTIDLCAQMMVMAGKASSIAEGRALAEGSVSSGAALQKLYDMVEAQGGDVSFLKDPSTYPAPAATLDFVAGQDGFVTHIDCLEVGLTNVGMGAGRQTVEDVIDMTAGMEFHVKVGDQVKAGDVMVTMAAASDSLLQQAEARMHRAVVISAEPREDVPVLISHLVTKEGVFDWPPQ